MKCKLLCYLTLALLAVGLIACSGSDDEGDEQPTKPTTQSPTTSVDEGIAIKTTNVDFVAEEAAIREIFAAHDAAITEQDIDALMDLWLERDVLMVSTWFANAFNIFETSNAIKDAWVGTWKLVGKRPITSTIQNVGISANGKKATASGTFKYPDTERKIVAEFKKDTKGDWKIRAIDYAEQNLVKEIETPKPEA